MFAKKSSQIIKYPKLNLQQELSIKILDIMIEIENRPTSLSYILSQLEYNSRDIYKVIHSLLSDGVLEKVIITACPSCSENNASTDGYSKVKCQFCGETYYPYNYEEKFIIKKEKFNYIVVDNKGE